MKTAGIAYARRCWGKPGLAVVGVLCAVSVAPLFGQATPIITHVGYEVPVPVVSPGQIITLFVAAVGGVQEAHAETIPLPTELGGFQVLVATTESPRTPAPILAVETARGVSDQAAVTVQIPYETQAVSSPQLPTATALVVSKDGRESPAIIASTVELAPRVVKRCEYMGSLYRYVCTPMITHADGSLVTWEQPAKPGEVLVMYALGLGRTIPPTPTGAAPAEPRAVEFAVAVQLFFEYRQNALPRVPPPGTVSDRPLYVGAVPGFVGLYQINFRVPPAPQGIPLCQYQSSSNLTVTVASKIYDGADICVQP